MDGAHACAYPHYSWLAHWLTINPPRVFDLYECRHVTHRLLLTTEGEADVVWTTSGGELRFHVRPGDIGFFPADQERHAFSFTTAARYRSFVLCIPKGHLPPPCEPGQAAAAGAFAAIPVFRDALMHASLERLSGGGGRQRISENVGDEVAARHVLARLAGITGGGAPAWPGDATVFTPGVMRRIVDQIDAHLERRSPLDEMSLGFGLSSGHFARKFEYSAGLSLNRFVNRRRIGIAIGMLAGKKSPLSQLSLDLGFSSQSHFTRMFRGLTGITPGQFRRLQARAQEPE